MFKDEHTNRKGEIEMEKLNYKGDVALFTTTHIKPRRLDIYWIDLGKGNGKYSRWTQTLCGDHERHG